MKVLYILDPGTVGGATRAFMELVVQLKDYGVEPIVLTGSKNDFNIELNKLGINNISIGHKPVLVQIWTKSWKRRIVYIVNKAMYLLFRFKALYIVSKNVDLKSIDLIHTNSARNDIGCFLNKKYKIPHICHIREFGDLDFNCTTLNSNYINIFNKYTTSFLAISNAVKKHWCSKGIIASKIRVVYDGVSPFGINTSEASNKHNKILRMVIAGGVFPTKGQHIAVEAIGLLPKIIRENVTLDIIGWYSKSYVDYINLIISKYKIQKNISILGPKDNVRSLYCNYQIGLMCSRNEGFGLVTAEYMHAGLGVIASDSGACPELIKDKVHGMLFKMGDAKSLSEKISELFNDRALLVELSINAQKRAREIFTSQNNAKQIIDIYNTLRNEKNIDYCNNNI